MSFAHLHTHTEYSLLDGAARIEALLDHCQALGMTSMAITDHGVMYGVVDFYKEAKKRGIHPVIGCEVYVAPRDMTDKQGRADREYAHLVLLAENQAGYQNLIELVSRGFIEGFYYKPRIDYDLLSTHSEGLICLTACLSGDIPSMLLDGRDNDAEKLARRLMGMFPDRLYIEIQDHKLPDQQIVLPKLVALAKKLHLPLVATNDIHYTRREDAEAHEVLLCIQTNRTMEDNERMRFGSQEFYCKSPEEMTALFAAYPEAIENTGKIAEQCQVDFDFKALHLPSFDVPDGRDASDYLRELSIDGLRKRYGEITSQLDVRLSYELDMIKTMGYSEYYLIVWDFIKFAKDNEIVVGPGRGSGAGSLVAYAVEITDVDPIKYGLIFERFLNLERITMPDFDVDFCYERRQEVIDYVTCKYGRDRVAQIITFGTMAARLVLRDVGRALGMTYADVDAIAKMVPFELKMTLDRALQVSPELRTRYENDTKITQLINIAQVLEGLPRHASTHAAGVVISKRPLITHVPLQLNDEAVTTQFSMKKLEDLGLLKFDFLGLRTLTVIRDTLRIVEETTGEHIDISTLPQDDRAVYDMIGNADTDGVFQLESSGMRSFMKELKPDSLEDIIAGISLYRPGPMQYIPKYVKGKFHPETVSYLHPMLEPILSLTYGCTVYQEQVMQIVRDLAGYSMGRSDEVRRAMSKKDRKTLAKEREVFMYGLEEDGQIKVPGAVRNGVPEAIANQIFDEMMDFAQYAFNKSHAACYAVVAYETGWLKVHHFVPFMAATMNSMMGSGKVPAYIQYCKKQGIAVLAPDINRSLAAFTVENGGIRFGLGAVKNVGIQAIDDIIRARTEGAFTSFADFCRRVDYNVLNKRMVESLIKVGAFDSTGANRNQLLVSFDRIMDGEANHRKSAVDGQVTLFEIAPDTQEQVATIQLPDIPDFDLRIKLSMEKEMAGLYFTGHPLEDYRAALEKMDTNTLELHALETLHETGDTSPLSDGQMVRIGGILSAHKTKATKKGDKMMAFITIEDLYGEVECLVFPTVLQRYEHLLTSDAQLEVRGRISLREEEEVKLLIEDIRELPLTYEPWPETKREWGERNSNRSSGRFGYGQEPENNQGVEREWALGFVREEGAASYGLANATETPPQRRENNGSGYVQDKESGYGARSGVDTRSQSVTPVDSAFFAVLPPPYTPEERAVMPVVALPHMMATTKAKQAQDVNNGMPKLYLRIPPGREEWVQSAMPILQKHPGECPVVFYMEAQKQKMKADRALWVAQDEGLVADLGGILGADGVKWG